jgi:cytidylate kinase
MKGGQVRLLQHSKKLFERATVMTEQNIACNFKKVENDLCEILMLADCGIRFQQSEQPANVSVLEVKREVNERVAAYTALS